jgi:hypothetical protein
MRIRNHFIFEFQLPTVKGNKWNLLQTLLIATVPPAITLVVQTLPQNLSIPSVTVPTVTEVAFIPPGTCKKGAPMQYLLNQSNELQTK